MAKRIVSLQALASTPGELNRQLKSVEESALHYRIAPDAWSAMSVLAHLLDVELRYLKRLKRVVNEEHPLLPIILPNEKDRHEKTSAEELAALFERARARTIAFLKELSPDDWRRKAVHETWGDTTLGSLVQHLINHDLDHLNQLREILNWRQKAPKEEQNSVSPG